MALKVAKHTQFMPEHEIDASLNVFSFSAAVCLKLATGRKGKYLDPCKIAQCLRHGSLVEKGNNYVTDSCAVQ